MDYPILVVNGEAGSAKSTLCRYMRGLIDPNVAELRRTPRSDDDLMIAATNAWAVAFDNLSGIKQDMSDALCCLATGGSLGKRQLFSNDDETLLVAKRPIIINGINDLLDKTDLASRALQLFLPPIPPSKRRAKRDLDAAYQRAKPRLLGALLDAVSAGMANLPEVQLDDLPRMADVAEWVVAAEPGLGLETGTFTAAYADNREAATEQAIDASPVGPAITAIIDAADGPDGCWIGTATELLQQIDRSTGDPQRKVRGWPTTPKALANAMRRLAPALRSAGYAIEEPPKKGKGHDKRKEWRLGQACNPRPARSAQPANAPQGLDKRDSERPTADHADCMPPAELPDADPPPTLRCALEAAENATHDPQRPPADLADLADLADDEIPNGPRKLVRI